MALGSIRRLVAGGRRAGLRLSRLLGRLRRRHPRSAALVAISLAMSVVVLTAVAASAARDLLRSLPDESAIARLGEMDQATTVYDASGFLVFTIYKERRLDVPLERVSPHLIEAVLAVEDRRFYDHRGFDLVRIGAAAIQNVRRGRVVQGASTITQQLARQSFLTPDKTLHRKLQEIVLSARIERRYAKPDILRLYLNKVYFGDGLYGIEAAARGYFGRSASDLTVAQAALLAGLVKSPATYAPTVSLERATERRDVVLQVMRDAGVIGRDVWERARQEPVELRDSLRSDEPYGQYFKEQVRRELVARFGWSRVYQGGLKVYATLDRRLQQSAERAVAEQLAALEANLPTGGRPRQPPASGPLQAALVALDPQTGEVRAKEGERDFAASSFNRAVQARRQPGSAFKPFVYAAALEAGFTPATIVEHLDVPIDTLQGSWTPEEAHATGGPLSIRDALRLSSNRAAVRVLQDVGVAKAVSYARALGVGDVPSVPSLALGSGEVTLQSLTAAYAAFANEGLVAKPYLVRRVEDRDGEVLLAESPSTSRAVSEATAYLMADMMADVINGGTGARARSLGFVLPAAGKTGTTNEYRDAWFVGFTPKLATGVWVGFDQPRTIARRGFASDVAVPLWASFMKRATQGDRPEWLTPPLSVVTAEVCRLSGKRPTSECERIDREAGEPRGAPLVYTEYFARGTEPSATCPLHPERGFFGTVASIFTGSGGASAPRPAVGPRWSSEPAGQTVDPPKKKRGFWARLFGRRDSRDVPTGDGRHTRGAEGDRRGDR